MALRKLAMLDISFNKYFVETVEAVKNNTWPEAIRGLVDAESLAQAIAVRSLSTYDLQRARSVQEMDFERMWKFVTFYRLTQIIGKEDHEELARCYDWIEDLMAEKFRHKSTFCFAILHLGQNLICCADRVRSRALLAKGLYFTQKSDAFGMGDMSHRALSNDIGRTIQIAAEIESDDWAPV